MNRLPLAPVALSALLMLGLAACSPKKEKEPPPKAGANAPAAEAAPAAKLATALPSLGAAPAWQLPDLNGVAVKSDQFKGRVLVVDFWATWCPPCREEIPGYIELVRKYGKDGFAIVGVSLDQGGPTVVKAFAEKFGINYQLVMGDDNVVATFGGVEAIPTTFLIDRAGQIRDKKIGAEPAGEYAKKVAALLN